MAARPLLPPRQPSRRRCSTRAERTLRDAGGELSLRELAREVGVSHAAPRRHFPDKQALLDALAEDGFERLGRELAGDAVAGGASSAGCSPSRRAYVRFAMRTGRCSS